MESVQTREENGALEFFNSLADAYQYAQSNPNVWKISYSNDEIDHRWVKYSRAENDANLLRSSEIYRDCSNPNAIFWVDEPMSLLRDEVIRITRELSNSPGKETELELEQRLERLSEEMPIRTCLTSEEFEDFIKNSKN